MVIVDFMNTSCLNLFQNTLTKLSENQQSHCTILDAKINQLTMPVISINLLPVAKTREPIE